LALNHKNYFTLQLRICFEALSPFTLFFSKL